MGYDDVITHLGDFGKYQKRIYFLLCLPGISCAFHKIAGVFLLARPDFRCELPFEFGMNNTQYELPEHVWQLAYPKDPSTDKYLTCQYYDTNYTQEYLNGSSTTSLDKMSTVYCDKYIYDTSKFKNSAVTEWNMVCGRKLLSATSDSLFMFGVLLGSIIFGQMSDKYGRKPIFFASLVIQVIFGVLAAISPEYITYTFSRMVIGATTSGVFLVAYVISMEMVGPSYRLFAGVACMIFFSIGFMLLGVFAYFITDWRWLQIGLTLPGVLFLTYYWFIPESARWLLSQNRNDDAIANIQKAARVNKVTIPDEVLDDLLEDTKKRLEAIDPAKKEPSVFDLFRYPNLRRKTLLIFFDWFVSSGTYYGLSWNTNNLGDNVIINFVIAGGIEIPAHIFLLLTLNRWGRRSILCGCMILGGVSLLMTAFVPDKMNWLIVTFAMVGKFGITASLGTIYLFTSEQFPTVVRNVGLGASSMVARIGGMMAPYFNVLSDIWRPMPLVIFGAMAFTAGLMSLLLPETHNKPTLETIEDGENFGKKPKNADIVEEGEELEELKKEFIPATNGNGVTQKQCYKFVCEVGASGYSQDDLIITSCPSAEQVPILLSSTSRGNTLN